MKKLRRATLTALGLLPAFFATDIVAEERPQSIGNTQVYTEVLQGDKTAGHLDVLVPLLGTETNFMFSSLQGYMKGADEQTYGLGFGYRMLSGNSVYGINTFYDKQRSKNKNDYSRVTFGFERLSDTWDVRTNYYQYLGTKEYQVDKGYVSGELIGTGQGVKQISLNRLTVDEQAHSGYDMEVGHNLGLKNVKAYVGAYSFGSDLTGWKARAEYSFAKRYKFSLLTQRDTERGTQFYAGFSMSFGKKVGGRNTYELLYQPVLRDMQVASTEQDNFTPELQSEKVFVVNSNANNLTLEEALAQSKAGDYIYVEEDQDLATIVNINLKENQSLYGAGADLVVDGVTLKKATTAPEFTNGNIIVNNPSHYEGFFLNGTGVENDGFVINGAANVTLKNITIENYNINGTHSGIRIGETAAATVSLENVQANNNDYGLRVDSGSATVTGTGNQFNNNTFDGVAVIGSGASATIYNADLSDNGFSGLYVESGAASLYNSSVNRNSETGIYSITGGTVDIFSGSNLSSNTSGTAGLPLSLWAVDSNTTITIHDGVVIANNGGQTVVRAQNGGTINITNPTSLVGDVSAVGTGTITINYTGQGSPKTISDGETSSCNITDGVGTCS